MRYDECIVSIGLACRFSLRRASGPSPLDLKTLGDAINSHFALLPVAEQFLARISQVQSSTALLPIHTERFVSSENGAAFAGSGIARFSEEKIGDAEVKPTCVVRIQRLSFPSNRMTRDTL